MSSSQLAKSSFVNIKSDNQTVSGSVNVVLLTVGIVEGRSFSDFVSIFVSSDAMPAPDPAQRHRSRVPSRTHPPPDVTVE